MRKILGLTIIFVAIAGLGLFALLNWTRPKGFSICDEIIKAIDVKYGTNEPCDINIIELTSFKWDRGAIFEVGSSRAELNEALGIEYKESTDLMSGIVFVYDKKIVYREMIPYNPERPSKLWIRIDTNPETSCIALTPNNAIVKGKRTLSDGKYYYRIGPEETK